MPEHSIGVKWRSLATKLGWDQNKILELKRFALVTVSYWPDAEDRHNFLQYYFPEDEGEVTPSFYNANNVLRKHMKSIMNSQEVDTYMDRFAHYSTDELIEWVKYESESV